MGRSQRLVVWFAPIMNEFCLRSLNLFVFLGKPQRAGLHVPGKQPAKRKEGSSRCFTALDQELSGRGGNKLWGEQGTEEEHSHV